MFHNRSTREFALESRKSFIRPTGGFPTQYGPLSYERGFGQFGHLTMPMNNFGWHAPFAGTSNYTSVPHADILETDEQFILEVALPGVVLDDVQLKIEYNVLTICAKRTPTLFEERAVVLQKELPLHHMLRHFEFDTEVLIEQIEARLDRGILYISVPKAITALRIPVSAGMIESTLPSGNTKTRVNSKHEISVK